MKPEPRSHQRIRRLAADRGLVVESIRWEPVRHMTFGYDGGWWVQLDTTVVAAMTLEEVLVQMQSVEQQATQERPQ